MNKTKKQTHDISKMDKNDKLIRYSMQLGMLRILVNANELSEKEYEMVKSRLMHDYNMYPHMLWD